MASKAGLRAGLLAARSRDPAGSAGRRRLRAGHTCHGYDGELARRNRRRPTSPCRASPAARASSTPWPRWRHACCCRCCCADRDLDWARLRRDGRAWWPAARPARAGRPAARRRRRSPGRPGDGAGAGGGPDRHRGSAGAAAPTTGRWPGSPAAAPVVALLYDGELVEALPAEPHDRPVGAVITPAGRAASDCRRCAIGDTKTGRHGVR